MSEHTDHVDDPAVPGTPVPAQHDRFRVDGRDLAGLPHWRDQIADVAQATEQCVGARETADTGAPA